jgi:hypothetical protein
VTISYRRVGLDSPLTCEDASSSRVHATAVRL